MVERLRRSGAFLIQADVACSRPRPDFPDTPSRFSNRIAVRLGSPLILPLAE